MKGGKWVSQRTKYQTAYGIKYNDLIREIDNIENGQTVAFNYFRLAETSGHHLIYITGNYNGIIHRDTSEPKIKINGDEYLYRIQDIEIGSFQIL